MVIDNILHESGSGVSRTYLIPKDTDKILVPDTEDISSNSNNNLLTENILCLLEDIIIAEKEAKEITNDSSGLAVSVLKDRE